jgi:hypothetical protein
MEYKTALRMTCEDLRKLLSSQTGSAVYRGELQAIEASIERQEERKELENLGKRIQTLMRTLSTVYGNDGTPILNAERYKQFMRESLFDEPTSHPPS